jgi:Mg-chelatase subunit ChlD
MSNTPNDQTADKGAVHVQMVLDRSGSMHPIAAATVDAINGFLAKQRKQPGVLRITLADFDSQEPFRIVADAIPIAEMMDLTPADYQPRGGTPLLDAIGLAVERCEARAVADSQEDQVLVIITDGHENASTDFTGQQIAKLLEAKQEEDWTVLFLGANQDSFATGAGINLREGNVRDFSADASGIKDALLLTSDAVSTHRSRGREERARRKDTLFDETDRS